MEDNKVENIINFEDEVMDIKLVKDFEQNKVFIVSLKNGKLKGYNESFSFIFDIPSRFNINKTRYVLALSNLNQDYNNNGNTNNNIKGDFLLITEGKFIDVFNWIKPGSFKVNHSKNDGAPKPNFPPFKGGQYFPPYPSYYQGNQFYPKGEY